MKKHLLIAVLSLSIVFVNAQYTWVNKSQFPDSGFEGGGGFVINGMGYVVGGFISPSLSMTANTWEYNPTTNIWTPKANYPVETSPGAFFTMNGLGYVVGVTIHQQDYI